jgi:hypothetical protein
MIVAVALRSESADHYQYLFEDVKNPEHLVELLDEVMIEEWQYLYIEDISVIGENSAEYTRAVQKKIEEAQQLEDGFYD